MLLRLMPVIGDKWLTWGMLALGAGALNACVVGIENRPSRQQIAQGPPPPPLERPSAMGLVTSSRFGMTLPMQATAEPPANRRGDQVQMAGYYHWDGVRYVWVDERVESRDFPFRRK